MRNLLRRDTNQPLSTRYTSDTWDPFRVMESMLQWDPSLSPSTSTGNEMYVPKFDVKETKDAYVFTADLPGIKEENLDISLTGTRLVISGKRETEQTKDNDRYHLYERSYGSFSRSFTLPEGIDGEHVNAQLKDGVLTLTVPKKPEVQPRRIAFGAQPTPNTQAKGTA